MKIMGWKFKTRKMPHDTAAFTLTLFRRNEYPIPSGLKLVLVIYEHCSCRPCSRFQSEVLRRLEPLSALLRYREQDASYVQFFCSYDVSIRYPVTYQRHHLYGADNREALCTHHCAVHRNVRLAAIPLTKRRGR